MITPPDAGILKNRKSFCLYHVFYLAINIKATNNAKDN